MEQYIIQFLCKLLSPVIRTVLIIAQPRLTLAGPSAKFSRHGLAHDACYILM